MKISHQSKYQFTCPWQWYSSKIIQFANIVNSCQTAAEGAVRSGCTICANDFLSHLQPHRCLPVHTNNCKVWRHENLLKSLWEQRMALRIKCWFTRQVALSTTSMPLLLCQLRCFRHQIAKNIKSCQLVKNKTIIRFFLIHSSYAFHHPIS